MALKLLVDECLQSKLLVAKLRGAGHDVTTVMELELMCKPDGVVFGAAIAEDRLVITINCADFVALGADRVGKGGTHPGILLVYRHNIPTKEMVHADIIKAISNLEKTDLDLRNGCHKLNDYNY